MARQFMISIYYDGVRQVLDRYTTVDVVKRLFREQQLLANRRKMTVSQCNGNITIKLYSI